MAHMTKPRSVIIYALSLLALLFLIALGFAAWRDPAIRNRPLRVAPLDAWELLDFGLLRGSSRPASWSSKGQSQRTINTTEVIGKRVTWSNRLVGEPGVYISQEIRKYQSEAAAADAYTDLIAITFDRGRNNEVAWRVPDDLAGPVHADEASLQCLDDETDYKGWEQLLARGIPADIILLPRRHCVLVARYLGLVTELNGNIFRDTWMTPKRFQRVLDGVDQPMSRAAFWWRELYEVKP